MTNQRIIVLLLSAILIILIYSTFVRSHRHFVHIDGGLIVMDSNTGDLFIVNESDGKLHPWPDVIKEKNRRCKGPI